MVPRGKGANGEGATQRARLEDIAAKVGVSKGAVSFALNGKPGVSDATRARVLEVAAELDWGPNSAARALGGAGTSVIGLVLARPAKTLGVEPFFAELTSGIQAALSERGFAVQMQIVESLEAEIEIYRRWWREHRVDGVIMVDRRPDDPRIEVVNGLGIPAVMVGGPGEEGQIPTVWVDDWEAMTSIVDYLAALGHRRIAHVGGVPEFLHSQRRIDALEAARHRLGLPELSSVVTDFSDQQGASATRRLLSASERPSAIVFDNDVMALAGLGVAMEMNIAVPAMLSIVSFDDSLLTSLTHPAITALSRDTIDFGYRVALLLLESVKNPPPTGGARSQRLPTPTLQVRASTTVVPRESGWVSE
ncbi:LacI family DNA-binding transcriptional regulator [Psychromicrobium xiongbiense]|uniref:LacI family DNA-binding transcriptional regulator n=1 Tax=Psychromicrobium xiongbiense TaxID=3051184 RepID=UPI002554E04C|nr:LacI family DNA-binding transcriptional regulator [Psychromicrobium sp. YIM S02556]